MRFEVLTPQWCILTLWSIWIPITTPKQNRFAPGIDPENRVVHRIGIVACFISAIVQGRCFGAESCQSNWNVPQKIFWKKKKWRSVGIAIIENAADTHQEENMWKVSQTSTEGSHGSHVVSQDTSHADCLKTKNLPHPPTPWFCTCRGNCCSSFGMAHRHSSQPLQIYEHEKPKADIDYQSRWDPLKNTFMMVRVERKATVFRYPSPSSPTIPTLYKYREPCKSRR